MTREVLGFKDWDFDALAKILQEIFGVRPKGHNNIDWGEYVAFDEENTGVYLVRNQFPPGSTDPEETAEPDFPEYPIVLYGLSDTVPESLIQQTLAIPRAQWLR